MKVGRETEGERGFEQYVGKGRVQRVYQLPQGLISAIHHTPGCHMAHG